MNEEIKQYLLEVIAMLDGAGLVITDEDLIDEGLEELSQLDFTYLKQIIKGE